MLVCLKLVYGWMLSFFLNKCMQESLSLRHKESKIYKLPFPLPWHSAAISQWDLNSGPPENRWWRPYLLADHSMGQRNLVWWCSHLKYNASVSLSFASVFQINALFLSAINISFLFGLPPQTDLEQIKPTDTIPFVRFRLGW